MKYLKRFYSHIPILIRTYILFMATCLITISLFAIYDACDEGEYGRIHYYTTLDFVFWGFYLSWIVAPVNTAILYIFDLCRILRVVKNWKLTISESLIYILVMRDYYNYQINFDDVTYNYNEFFWPYILMIPGMIIIGITHTLVLKIRNHLKKNC